MCWQVAGVPYQLNHTLLEDKLSLMSPRSFPPQMQRTAHMR